MTVSKSIPSNLLDTLLSNYQKPEDLLGENGLLKQLTKALVERALEAELTGHLGRAKHEIPSPIPAAIRATARAKRRSKATLGNCRLRFHVTARAALNRN